MVLGVVAYIFNPYTQISELKASLIYKVGSGHPGQMLSQKTKQ